MINNHYFEKIRAQLNNCLQDTQFLWNGRRAGKVRDTYELDNNRMVMIATDRQSAFDRAIACVPFKGQVLNLTSYWWFQRTQHIIANHVIAVPDPNVMVVKKCRVLPIEFVVRGYLTGSTNTSLWTHYNRGERKYCGHVLPEGLRKNQQLPQPLLTPTTKDAVHDRPISAEEILAEGMITREEWDQASAAALRLYEYGVEVARKHGLILVDTKYEFGCDENGRVILIDEIHTPDSSRYWLAGSYAERHARQEEPEYIDKEFLRLWFVDNCDPYQDKELPQAPEQLIVQLAGRYIQLYEMITGETFPFAPETDAIEERIWKNVHRYLQGDA